MKLTQKDINSSESEYSEIQINYAPPELPDTPEAYIIDYLEELHVGYDYYESIIDFYNHLCKKDSKFGDKYFSRDVCLALIIKYLNDNGYTFGIKEICNIFSRKENKIKEIIKYIEKT